MMRRTDRRLAAGLSALALGLAVNSLLGPFGVGVVSYPLSETLVNQTIGLEAVSLLLVTPWCVAAARLVARGHGAGPILAIPPSAYAVYMFSQYVVGPQYLTYPTVLPLHMAIFVLGVFVIVLAWNRVRLAALPVLSSRRERSFGVVLFVLGAFLASRYLPAIQGIATGSAIPAEFADDPTMYWTIFLLDLGLVLPVTVAAGIGLRRGADWARKALYGVVGWFALVPISVAAMSITMVVNDDPNAALGNAVVLSVAAVLFAVFAAWVYRPLVGSNHT